MQKQAATFWSRVREAMRDRGMRATQKEAARLIGISQPSVNDWAKPGGYPTIANCVKLAVALGVCVEWLYTGRGDKRPTPARDPVAERLWGLWPDLDDITRGELVGFAIARSEVARGKKRA